MPLWIVRCLTNVGCRTVNSIYTASGAIVKADAVECNWDFSHFPASVYCIAFICAIIRWWSIVLWWVLATNWNVQSCTYILFLLRVQLFWGLGYESDIKTDSFKRNRWGTWLTLEGQVQEFLYIFFATNQFCWYILYVLPIRAHWCYLSIILNNADRPALGLSLVPPMEPTVCPTLLLY